LSERSFVFGEHLFTKVVHGTRSVQYVANMDDIRSKKIAPPLQGARVDSHVEITFLGPKVKGTGIGVDYVNYRADGLIELHVHEEITTEDGAKIAGFATGTGHWEADVLHVREEISFSTGDPRYSWLNVIHAWGRGMSKPGENGLRIDVYSV